MIEDKARDRVESGDSGRERNAVIRAQEPAAARMDFFNGLLADARNIHLQELLFSGLCQPLSDLGRMGMIGLEFQCLLKMDPGLVAAFQGSI